MFRFYNDPKSRKFIRYNISVKRNRKEEQIYLGLDYYDSQKMELYDGIVFWEHSIIV